MATENTMATEIDPDKSLIQSGNNDDGISDSLSESDITDNPPTNEQATNEQAPTATAEEEKQSSEQSSELELLGKIDLSFDKLSTEHKTIGPTAQYNKILEKIVKTYKKWDRTNYGTYAKKLKSGSIVEYDGYSLPTIDGNLISDYLINPTDSLAEELKSI